ncbi:MAG: hypothetical protein AAF844_14275 [Pseudomonadota bacterium]
MTRPPPRGWCPTAERPMASGDGLIMRLRPPMGRIETPVLRRLIRAATRHGSGILEVTSRASLQIRGVSEASRPALLAECADLGLVPATPTNGAGLTVQPFWRKGDGTDALANTILKTLSELPALPAKFGVTVDQGENPVLSEISADIRIERSENGGLIVRADGAPTGRAVPDDRIAEAVAALALWFLGTDGPRLGRMRRHIQSNGIPSLFQGTKPRFSTTSGLGPTTLGPIVGLPFGQATASELESLLDAVSPAAIRLTPWRAFLLEGASNAPIPAGFITSADDPLARVEACPGAPACPSASVATRPLARAIASAMPPGQKGRLHVSGCAKGCARPTEADTVLVGRDGAFDLVRSGHAWDTPVRQGLAPDEAALIGAIRGDA